MRQVVEGARETTSRAPAMQGRMAAMGAVHAAQRQGLHFQIEIADQRADQRPGDGTGADPLDGAAFHIEAGEAHLGIRQVADVHLGTPVHPDQRGIDDLRPRQLRRARELVEVRIAHMADPRFGNARSRGHRHPRRPTRRTRHGGELRLRMGEVDHRRPRSPAARPRSAPRYGLRPNSRPNKGGRRPGRARDVAMSQPP